ncbi:ABC-type transport system involved in multi-copper enzyme maturation permease subunit [Pseudomonas fluvialis]|uniref:ABC-type transport system involved in multi-copper enzyme maturation permease subunit n=1 Tax=Pseudomonas fluvialis TaxID=1793966 RepID=A0A7X0BQP0_9PSED|nr:ABC-type transport system involved in multi-copper enzyme maturation permease subunit [Pseudomonas fluvialis]
MFLDKGLLAQFRLALQVAVRGKIGLWCGLTLALGCLVFLASMFSARQPATVSLDIGISVIRIFLPMLIFVVVHELISREFERKYYLCTMVYPLSRVRWLVSRILAAWLLAIGLLVWLFVLLGFEVFWISGWYQQSTPVSLLGGLSFTAALLVFDALVFTAVVVFLSVFSSSAGFVFLGGAGFLIIARSYSSVLELLGVSPWVVGDGYAGFYRNGVGWLYYLVPDLGQLDVRGVALYSTWEVLPSGLIWSVTSSVIYAFIFIALAIFAVRRRCMD